MAILTLTYTMVYALYMQRTQIYLPENQLGALRKEAFRHNTTVSEIVRNLIDKDFGRLTKTHKKHEALFDAAKRINKLGVKGPRDLASKLDAYLYGGEKRPHIFGHKLHRGAF